MRSVYFLTPIELWFQFNYEGGEQTVMESKHVATHAGSSLAGVIWFIGWLFTIGYANLVWWKIILGLVVWPYYLAQALG
jgi:hypothetical protein